MIKTHRSYFILTVRIILLVIILTASGCGHRNRSGLRTLDGKPLDLRYSSLLTIKEGDGFSEVEIRNPWDSTAVLQRLLLIDSESELPANVEGVQVIRVPLERAVVFSSVHASLMSELGHAGSVAGICDKDYITDRTVRDRLEKGKIADCGSSMSPSTEMIISLRPDAVLASPYDNGGGNPKTEKFGVPTIQCADYMETSPLGRAEWIRFYARLLGEGEKGDSIFDATEKSYLSLRDIAQSADTRPTVIYDRVYGQTWDQPGGQSTLGILTEDAGGSTPFINDRRSGRIPLSPEKIIYDAGETDFWLIRYAGAPLTLSSLAKERASYSRLKPFKTGNVYGCETISSNIFDDQAFHPQWVLSDLISVLHPELPLSSENKKYFHRLRP